MVGVSEGISRLITESVLLQTERQLLRNRGQSEQQPDEQPPQPPPTPISHNDKALAPVLLTLLEEQLDVAALNRPELPGDSGLTQDPRTDATSATTRIVAQYEEAKSVYRPDLTGQQAPLQAGTSNQQAILVAASPELRMAMQSAFLSAAMRAKADIDAAGGTHSRRRESMTGASGRSLHRIAAGVCAGIVLVIVLALKFGH